MAKAPTERERDFLRTLDVLYGEGTKNERDFLYADAMAALHAHAQNFPIKPVRVIIAFPAGSATDIIGRVIRYPYEIPISVVVGVIGSMIVLFLLLRTRRHAS